MPPVVVPELGVERGAEDVVPADCADYLACVGGGGGTGEDYGGGFVGRFLLLGFGGGRCGGVFPVLGDRDAVDALAVGEALVELPEGGVGLTVGSGEDFAEDLEEEGGREGGREGGKEGGREGGREGKQEERGKRGKRGRQSNSGLRNVSIERDSPETYSASANLTTSTYGEPCVVLEYSVVARAAPLDCCTE